MMWTATLLLAAASVLPADSAMWQMATPAFSNPAVKQWMLPQSHSSIGPEYEKEHLNRPVDITRGTGSDQWKINAETYLKYKTSTLWGDASYSNGHQRELKWNETSDAALLYPYLTADSVGGDMNLERYRFAGGYADHSDKWAWGGTISYDAGLYYRSVDPRPRNVTGLLDVSAGVAHHAWAQYYAGIALGYQKYKQSNDIDFKSQLGVEKIYHLGGLGNHYHRFAGTGTASHYSGNRFSVMANLYPSSGRGLALTAKFERFTFNKVLTDLNKLPLNHVWHNEMNLQAAFMHPGKVHSWGAEASFRAYRRHGQENIFGDATSNVYPQIASLDMYADNLWNPSVSGLWQYQPAGPGTLLWIRGNVGYRHRAEVYAQPRRRLETNHATAGIETRFTMPFKNVWRFSIGASAGINKPVDCKLNLAESSTQEPQGIVMLEQYRYHFLSHTSRNYGAQAGLQRSITSKVGLALRLIWQQTSYCSHTCSNNLSASLSVIF
ncbi:MAG: hypothetical protein NC338_04245 [Firmicutes bacterium]|nr:hypothetical protein [Bacillota bacterium]MCM1401493.1 hypothetical protein [Bacteroides sp.]MCM1477812.1 hypothetical protein [Bacteroides sp.]